jgi:uncharacterized membrane protein
MSTTPDAAPPRQVHYSRIRATLKALVRARITAGLLVVLPVWVSYLLVKFLFGAMRDASQWAVMGVLRNPWFQQHVWQVVTRREDMFDVDQVLRTHQALDWGLAVFSVLLTVLFLYAIGLFTANVLGRRIIEWFELLLDKLPLVKTVYRSSKQILATFAGSQSQTFQRVAMFPFLSPGVYSIGFITSTFTDPRSGEEHVTIFYPTTPNPTTGFVFVMKRRDIIELDWTIEEAIKTVMSGGILMPRTVPMPQNAAWQMPGPSTGTPVPAGNPTPRA